jgi:glycosyltransferase involved in cell wall biosynthesis
MQKLLIVNNIPTPYRTFMFGKLHELGLERGIEVSVAFQAEREAHRHWKPSDFDMRFPHFYSSGMRFWSQRPRAFFTYTTLNLDIARRASSGAYDWVLMAPLNSVTGWLMSCLPAGRTCKLIWSESNLLSARYMSSLARRFKGWLLAPGDALVCPGERALEYIYALRPALRSLPTICLPNLVDTGLFERRVAELRGQRAAIRQEIGVPPEKLLILGVGRMVDYKGFGQVVEAAAKVPGSYQMIFLGDGERLETWRRRVRELGIDMRVRFDGQKTEPEVVRHLSAADWFLHPALEDPSPLVTIEAATAGLPLAVADQTGNSPETVQPGASGFRFDASRIDEIANTLEKMIQMNESQRRQFGVASALLARERFSPDIVVNRFFDRLQSLSPPPAQHNSGDAPE